VGGERPADAPWLGDEPELVLFRLPGVVVARCADRVAGARAAVREHGCDTLILDDGFQYLRLARDEDLVVLDATNPFGNGHLVPLGTLREPPAALSRATGIILTHCREPANADAVADDLAVRGIHALVQRTRHVPTALWNLGDGTPAPLSALNGATVRAVSGIGKPEGFAALLTGLGARVAEVVTLADHAEIPAQALRGAPKVVTTEKDAMRLRRRPLPEGAEAAWVLRIEARPV
jgi:tetraacyldisaccharide 4'-kinase